MITFDDLKNEKTIVAERLKPHLLMLEEAKEQYEKAQTVELRKLENMLETYYDQVLRDKNDHCVRIGDIITGGHRNYKVINRGMQIIFGEMLNNSSVECILVDKNYESQTVNPRPKSLHPSELKQFELIKPEGSIFDHYHKFNIHEWEVVLLINFRNGYWTADVIDGNTGTGRCTGGSFKDLTTYIAYLEERHKESFNFFGLSTFNKLSGK